MPAALSFQDFQARLAPSDRMPIVFVGHGSPMNAITDNPFADSWRELGKALPRPRAILCISAHWMTRGVTLVDVSDQPRTIHDFGNFPQELFEQQYPAAGAPDLARDVAAMLKDHGAEENTEWGLDHGSWSVLQHLYPNADVPVFQLSIDMGKPFAWHRALGQDLKTLRDQGVLVLGSGNLVHNLRELRFDGEAQDFAIEFDALTKGWLTDRDFDAMSGANDLGQLMRQAHPTPDHYIPALYTVGLVDKADELTFFNETIDLGSASMRSFIYA